MSTARRHSPQGIWYGNVTAADAADSRRTVIGGRVLRSEIDPAALNTKGKCPGGGTS